MTLLSFEEDEGPALVIDRAKKDGAARLQPSGFKAAVKEPKVSHTQVSAAGMPYSLMCAIVYSVQ